ncbi:MAG: Xylose isomerase-like barrel [Gemmataceae bacterium]|nr:Xylose isomerase-like barrel [Gemmataceae bacterium]
MFAAVTRRTFLKHSATAAGGLALAPAALAEEKRAPLFKISLAQWSLHRAFFGKKLDPLQFAAIAKTDYDIHAVEYVNQFYKDKKKDDAYLKDLKKVADDAGVRSVLIMCDGEGALGDPDEKKRQQAVENHYRWVEWAKFLGCHSIRVNAETNKVGTREEQAQRATDGLRKLTEFGTKHEIGVIVENHGGLSSDGAWLAGVMKAVDNKYCGTLPDFGNFYSYDRYKGVDELMPSAKGVSAKSHDFDDKGEETHTDYHKMMAIVVNKHNYHGFVGVEYEGGKLSEPDGIKATKKLLEVVRAELAKG